MKTEEIILAIGGLAAVGIVAYFLLTMKKNGDNGDKVVTAEISEISLY